MRECTCIQCSSAVINARIHAFPAKNSNPKLNEGEQGPLPPPPGRGGGGGGRKEVWVRRSVLSQAQERQGQPLRTSPRRPAVGSQTRWGGHRGASASHQSRRQTEHFGRRLARGLPRDWRLRGSFVPPDSPRFARSPGSRSVVCHRLRSGSHAPSRSAQHAAASQSERISVVRFGRD